MTDKLYALKKNVAIDPVVDKKLSRIANDYHTITGKAITVTSGTRSAFSQASAMYRKCASGGSLDIYRNRKAAAAIEKAYHEATASALSESDTVDIMAQIIEAQVRGGIYISAHLRAGAVDIRSKDMSDGEREHFRAIAEKYCSLVLLERRPPHWHLQL